MKERRPTISIITPVLNDVHTLRDCIESVLNQDSPSEHIIIDGGSTDGSLDVIAEYASRLGTVVSEPDENNCDAMNKGIAIARGDVVGILNADDFYAHERVLSKVRTTFETCDTDSCYGDLQYVDRRNPHRIIRYWKSRPYDPRLLYHGWMPPHPTLFVRRSVYERCGTFRLDQASAGDYELMLRFFLKCGISATYIPEVLVNMRLGGASSASVKNRLKGHLKDWRAWRINGLTPRPWTLILKPLSKIGQYVFKDIRKGR
jgi:glycosyltransferase